MSVSLGLSLIDGIFAANLATIGCRHGKLVPVLSSRTSSGVTGLERSYFYTSAARQHISHYLHHHPSPHPHQQQTLSGVV